MRALDFVYDGITLSSLGYMICNLNSDSDEVVSNGAVISFNTVSTSYGQLHRLVNTRYEETLTATFGICKDPCATDETAISLAEVRDLMRWLNRKEYLPFRFLADDEFEVTFNASFNVSCFNSGGQVVGLQLEMFTDKPFGYGRVQKKTISGSSTNWTGMIGSLSDEIGYIYPKTIITIGDIVSGTLSIHNDLDDTTTIIKDCVPGEVITMEYPLISSSAPDRNIQNRFNWEFIKLNNTFKNKKNNFTVSLPCTIAIEYSPIVKIGLL